METKDDILLDKLAEVEEAFANAGIPEVYPEWRYNDKWDGAAGAEIREHYEPYPHDWDRTLRWCQIKASMQAGLTPRQGLLAYLRGEIEPEIPMAVYGYALTYWRLHAQRLLDVERA